MKDNLSVCSYNIYWKIMDIEKSPLLNKMSRTDILLHQKNILHNIYYLHNYYNPFVYCFQEAANISEITKIFDQKEFTYHIGLSEPENILTIWNKTKLDIKLIFDSEFEPGRPFTLLLFKNKIEKYYFILINIHAGHNINTFETIFKPIQNIIDNNLKKIIKYNVKRIIIAGDFNRNINEELISNNILNLNINNIIFTFKPLINKNKTCCSLQGYGFKYNYDNVLDSFDAPIITHLLKNEPWYKPLSSDHLMILSILI